jgi:hypothetical protein
MFEIEAFFLAKPLALPYAVRPRSRRNPTNEDPRGIHMRRVFKNRPT